MEYDFVRYLEAKKSVDDRALNREVADAMKRFVRSFQGDLRILEIGAGHGAMIERLAAEGLLGRASYTAVDPDEASLAVARECFESDTRVRELELQAAALNEFASSCTGEWDLVIAHAVLDLLDLDQAIPVLESLCVPEGGFYFTINFDGETIFEPIVDPVLDAEIVERYHATMDARIVDGKRSGHSRTGRRLFGALAERGALIEQVGSSDWIVWPRDGAYADEEAYFLHFIVATVERALAGSPGLEGARLKRWAAVRHAQIERGTLVYLAHQLDFFGRWPKHPSRRQPPPSRDPARES